MEAETKISNFNYYLENELCIKEYSKIKFQLERLIESIKRYENRVYVYSLEMKKKEFEKKHSILIEEWEEYKPTQIKNGINLSLKFFDWLIHIKKLNFE